MDRNIDTIAKIGGGYGQIFFVRWKHIFAPKLVSAAGPTLKPSARKSDILHKTGWLVVEWGLPLHALVDRAMAIAQEMTAHCTLCFSQGLSREGKQGQSQIILKNHHCTHHCMSIAVICNTVLFLSFSVDWVMTIVQVTKVKQGHTHTLVIGAQMIRQKALRCNLKMDAYILKRLFGQIWRWC